MIPSVIEDIRAEADLIRSAEESLQRAQPYVRIWTNKSDSSPGIVLISDVLDTASGSFRFKKNQAGAGKIRLLLDSYVARRLIAIPDDPNAKKNIVITVDYSRGPDKPPKRWSGLLKNWVIEKSNGVYWLDTNWVDDLQFLQYMLGPPNPLLPIPIFQFPRVLPLFGPSKWACSLMIWLQLLRLNGNLWTLPDDPFNTESWNDLFDWSDWQVLIKSSPFDLDDSSTWALLATRMDRLDSVLGDALEDGQLTLGYHRILTVDGEVSDVPGVPVVNNGTLVLEVIDNSGFYNPNGSYLGGNLFSGLARFVASFASGFVETLTTFVADDQTVWPDEYYQPGYRGPKPGLPPVVIRDNKWSQMETARLSWAPATAVSVIVGGDNPYADQLAQLLIESVGALIGYFLLGGFSGLGSILAAVIMPFLQGTILAWLQWENLSRGHQLGWVHLYEIYQQGAENNAWSLSAIAALRAGFEATRSETSHQFTLTGIGAYTPFVDYDIGQRLGSTHEPYFTKIFVNQVEEIVSEWDWQQGKPHSFQATVGRGEAMMTNAERQWRALNKALRTLSNIGVHLVS